MDVTMAARKILRACGALLGAVLLAAAAPARADDAGGLHIRISAAGHVTGSGKALTETRAASGFQAVASRGAVQLVLRQGTREGVTLSGDDNVLPLVETRVVDRDGVPTLEIGIRSGTSLSTRLPLVATVDLVTLKSIAMAGGGSLTSDALKTSSLVLTLAGSANVRLRQLVADDVSVRVSGSGDLDFAGSAGKLAVTVSGSGDVNARALATDDVNVSIAGSGDVSVSARKTLTVSIAGSGSIAYAGDPVVKSSIAGQGSVRRLP